MFGSMLLRPILTVEPLLIDKLENIRYFRGQTIMRGHTQIDDTFNSHSPKSMSSST